jgi:CubicO group peptidase (beta-lactamase class C family)
MLLVDDGLLELDAPLSRYLPEWRGAGREAITIRDLLLHRSGLPAYGATWQSARGPAAYLREIVALPLAYAPRTRMVYSDYGAILLGLTVERVSGQTLDAFVAERVFTPLGMRDTGFTPVGWRDVPYVASDAAGPAAGTPLPPSGPAACPAEAEPPPGVACDYDPELLLRIAPTEVDTTFRHAHVHGAVHDENAFALGGVAGHAGLFSSARDLAVFAELLLNEGAYGGRRLIRAETVRGFTMRADTTSSRALGWDTPAGRSSAGDYFSTASFGHTGFTGTSLWMDPERDLFLVILTNRVNPTRANQRHIPLRRELADALQRAITDLPVLRRPDAARVQ